MDSFQITVLTIACVILILVLAYIGVNMGNGKTNKTSYPPYYDYCPDYWLSTEKGNCIIPTDGTNVGTLNERDFTKIHGYDKATHSIDFGAKSWGNEGKSKLCAQKHWANRSQIVWDGVSNFNSC